MGISSTHTVRAKEQQAGCEMMGKRKRDRETETEREKGSLWVLKLCKTEARAGHLDRCFQENCTSD